MSVSQLKFGPLSISSKEPIELFPDIFVVEGTFRSFFGVTFPLRTTILRSPNSDSLVVYSPFPPSAVNLSSLGSVIAIIAPNPFHDTFAHEFAAAHPNATLYASPAMRTGKSWGEQVTELEKVICEGIRMRCLTAFKGMQEVVLYHEVSKCLVVGDTCFNFTDPVLYEMGWGGRMFVKIMKGDRKCDVSVLVKMMMRGGCKHGKEEMNKMITEWDWDKVVMSHGEIIEKSGKEAFQSGIFAWVKSVADGQEGGTQRSFLLPALAIIAAVAFYAYTSGSKHS